MDGPGFLGLTWWEGAARQKSGLFRETVECGRRTAEEIAEGE